MVWGGECKSCKATILLERLSGPKEGPLGPRGSLGWAGEGIECPTCGVGGFLDRPDFKVFESLEPIPGEAKGELGEKPD